MADNLILIPVLVGMGVKVLTIPPQRFPQVQRVIQSMESPAAKELAEKILKAGTVAETARLLGIAWVFPGAE